MEEKEPRTKEGGNMEGRTREPRRTKVLWTKEELHTEGGGTSEGKGTREAGRRYERGRKNQVRREEKPGKHGGNAREREVASGRH